MFAEFIIKSFRFQINFFSVLQFRVFKVRKSGSLLQVHTKKNRTWAEYN